MAGKSAGSAGIVLSTRKLFPIARIIPLFPFRQESFPLLHFPAERNSSCITKVNYTISTPQKTVSRLPGGLSLLTLWLNDVSLKKPDRREIST